MRAAWVVIGAIIALIGAVWTLQGAGFLLGSFMSNDPTWLWTGAAVLLVGLGVVGFGLRPGRATNPP